MSSKLLIKGGTLVDPGKGLNKKGDLLCEDGVVEAAGKPGEFDSVSDAKVLDASGAIVTPGLIDIHVHLREPGFEWKETIESGARTAAAGGFTAVCCMPNTNPVIDRAQVVEFILERAEDAGFARVHPIGAISEKLKGESLAPMVELWESGCVAFSDDGWPVWNSALMRCALEYGKMMNLVLACHEEDTGLSHGFSMNESELSVELGLRGMPAAAENVMISRDIELALLTGARVHFCHVSTARGVELIRRAKADGANVTAETAPHYITLDETAVKEYDTSAKMSMPLRKQEDIKGLIEGLADGTIDCIASDHAPHEDDSKRVAFGDATLGILGLQTTVPLVLEKVREGQLSIDRAIASLSTSARNCYGLDQVSLEKGSVADVSVIDLEQKITFGKEHNLSLSSNSPFFGRELQGLARFTVVGGCKVFDSKGLYS